MTSLVWQVLATPDLGVDGRALVLRCGVCRDVLHHLLHLAAPVVVCVGVWVCGLGGCVCETERERARASERERDREAQRKSTASVHACKRDAHTRSTHSGA